jgi:Lysylphosphatidylglycerol synthase TM region
VDAVLVAALIAGARWLSRRPDLPLAAGRRVLGWTNAVLRRPPDRGADGLERLVGQLGSVRPGARGWTAAAAYAVGNWVFDVACLAAAAAALGVRGLTLPLLLLTYTAGMAASGISLLPGGIGVVDTAMVLTMVAGGIPAAAALPAVLLYRLISPVAVVTAGWVVAVRTRGQPYAVGDRTPPGLVPRPPPLAPPQRFDERGDVRSWLGPPRSLRRLAQRRHQRDGELVQRPDDRGGERQRVPGRRERRVRHGDDGQAGTGSRPQPVARVLDRHRPPRLHPQAPCHLPVDRR